MSFACIRHQHGTGDIRIDAVVLISRINIAIVSTGQAGHLGLIQSNHVHVLLQNGIDILDIHSLQRQIGPEMANDSPVPEKLSIPAES